MGRTVVLMSWECVRRAFVNWVLASSDDLEISSYPWVFPVRFKAKWRDKSGREGRGQLSISSLHIHHWSPCPHGRPVPCPLLVSLSIPKAVKCHLKEQLKTVWGERSPQESLINGKGSSTQIKYMGSWTTLSLFLPWLQRIIFSPFFRISIGDSRCVFNLFYLF